MNKLFPIQYGKYDAGPTLFKLSGKVFDNDTHFDFYRANKVDLIKNNIHSHFCTSALDLKILESVNEYLVNLFPKSRLGEGDSATDVFNSLALNFQEDVVILNRNADRNWVSLMHVCAPNFYSLQDKIGKSFGEIHKVIPGADEVVNHETKIVEAMINNGPFERFAWGLVKDCTLNCHPDEEVNFEFDVKNPKAFMRIERQCIINVPSPINGIDTVLFTIRTYFRGLDDLDKDEKIQLSTALESMTPDQLEYKRLTEHKANLMNWLRS
jgi:dimethylamine monooxygenase subunit A